MGLGAELKLTQEGAGSSTPSQEGDKCHQGPCSPRPQAPGEPACPQGASILPAAASLIWRSGAQILYGFQEVAMAMKCNPE